MNFIKRMISNTTPYKFGSWLYNKYLEESAMNYKPSQFKEFGQDVKIDRNVIINMPERVILKDRVSIYRGTMINAMGGLYVGENSGLGYYCTIFTAQHRYRGAETIPFDTTVELKPVIIREYVWTGARVTILPGIEIGEGAIIGMGSVVTKNIPPLAIVLGNPAEVIWNRSKEHYYRCKEDKKFQSIAIEKYQEIIPAMHKIKFEKELKELGLI